MRRVQRLLTFAFAFIAASLVFADSVLAEVCDKEVPTWSRTDGPVSPWFEPVHLLLSPVGWLILFVSGVGLVFGVRWLSVLGGCVCLACAGLLLASWVEMNEVYRAAIEEGCRSPHPFVTVAFLGTIAVALLGRNLLR